MRLYARRSYTLGEDNIFGLIYTASVCVCVFVCGHNTHMREDKAAR